MITTCPTLSELVTMAELASDSRQREDLEAHLASCSSCRSQLAESVRNPVPSEIQSLPTEVLERVRSLRPRPRFPNIRTVAAGLLAAALAIVVLWPQAEHPTDQDPHRGPTASLEELSVEGPLNRSDLSELARFAWKSPTPLLKVHLTILDTNAKVVLDRKFAGPELLISLADLGPGSYYWLVEGQTPGGSRIVSSVFSFEAGNPVSAAHE